MLCIWELEHKRDWKWRIVKIRYALNIGNVWRRPGSGPSWEGAGINNYVWKGEQEVMKTVMKIGRGFWKCMVGAGG